jgi:hypothetical protein
VLTADGYVRSVLARKYQAVVIVLHVLTCSVSSESSSFSAYSDPHSPYRAANELTETAKRQNFHTTTHLNQASNTIAVQLSSSRASQKKGKHQEGANVNRFNCLSFRRRLQIPPRIGRRTYRHYHPGATSGQYREVKSCPCP